MRAMILACAALLLASCGLFSPDVGPAAAAISESRAISDARLERELALCARIEDAEARARWEEAFRRDAARADVLAEQLLEWVDAVGELDWKTLYRDVRKAVSQ